MSKPEKLTGIGHYIDQSIEEVVIAALFDFHKNNGNITALELAEALDNDSWLVITTTGPELNKARIRETDHD